MGPAFYHHHRDMEPPHEEDGRRAVRRAQLRQEPEQDIRPGRDHRYLRRRGRRRGGEGRAEGDHRVPRDASEVPEHRGQDTQRHPPGGRAGHGQDPARQGRGRGGEGPVFQHERVGLRGDVRRRRRGEGQGPFRPGAGKGALHHLHRRTRRAGQGARPQPAGVPRREGADAQPASRRDGRLRHEEGRHHHGGDEQAGDPRPGAAAAGQVRQARPRRQAGHKRQGGDPSGSTPKG